jgi:hypothetical protein
MGEVRYYFSLKTVQKKFDCDTYCTIGRTVMCSNGLEREFFLAPDGSSFSGRKQALEFMKKSGNATEEDIRRMESGCKAGVYILEGNEGGEYGGGMKKI